MIELKTPWTDSVPDIPFSEHPRPQWKRSDVLILNGLWKYAIASEEAVRSWDGHIRVPFSPEAPLSGVNRLVRPSDWLFYEREVTIPAGWKDSRIRLHFDAVDQEAWVSVNGKEVGHHFGGFEPFEFDIQNFLDTERFTLFVKVKDLTDSGHGETSGKQRLKRGGIFYTPQSGIWGTVWLERLPFLALESVKAVPNDALDAVELRFETTGEIHPEIVAVVLHNGQTVARESTSSNRLEIALPGALPWTPDTPNLYDLKIVMGDDAVESYFAMRSFSRGVDARGIQRFWLNGKPTLLHGLLDQGYWPDGLLTPPSDEAMIFDIQTMKDLGFNFLRKHIKIEPMRWYHHCDRLGMIVWQDTPCGTSRKDIVLHGALAMAGIHLNDRFCPALFGRGSKDSRLQFELEHRRLIKQLENVPSIAAWVPFNEAWGQFDSKRFDGLTRELDSTRLVDHASGWSDQGVGDFFSRHIYFQKVKFPKHEGKKRILALTEFGGYSLPVEGHRANPDHEFGYKRYSTSKEWMDAVIGLYEQEILPQIERGLAVLVYTQVSDVEDEINGFLTYDRTTLKMDVLRFRSLSKRLNEAHASSLIQ